MKTLPIYVIINVTYSCYTQTTVSIYILRYILTAAFQVLIDKISHLERLTKINVHS